MTRYEAGKIVRRVVQAMGHDTRRGQLTWLGGWLCVMALCVWLSRTSVLAILAAAAGAALWTWGVRGEARWRWVTIVVLWMAVLVGVSVQFRLREIAIDWPQMALDGTPKQVFSQVDRLESLSLTAPQTVLLLRELDANLNLEALTVEECADQILNYLGA